ncbi:uncharacterized protein PAC_19113 [Phialocephala subalpina]|uniref:Uncharacterized protein n=1 Tax=Phialocephala subalpina TaxID=576137 RepID=A0A1L7XW00_9HELO|nr:uncharacterized protein PAC_19113 [Phialocephala subalpina]
MKNIKFSQLKSISNFAQPGRGDVLQPNEKRSKNFSVTSAAWHQSFRYASATPAEQSRSHDAPQPCQHVTCNWSISSLGSMPLACASSYRGHPCYFIDLAAIFQPSLHNHLSHSSPNTSPYRQSSFIEHALGRAAERTLSDDLSGSLDNNEKQHLHLQYVSPWQVELIPNPINFVIDTYSLHPYTSSHPIPGVDELPAPGSSSKNPGIETSLPILSKSNLSQSPSPTVSTPTQSLGESSATQSPSTIDSEPSQKRQRLSIALASPSPSTSSPWALRSSAVSPSTGDHPRNFLSLSPKRDSQATDALVAPRCFRNNIFSIGTTQPSTTSALSATYKAATTWYPSASRKT